MIETARVLRASMTTQEDRLWAELKGNALGVRFRRQHPLGGFVADFYAPSIGLIVELDGTSHIGMKHKDAARDAKLRRLGAVVLRVENHEIDSDVETVVHRIRAAVAHAIMAPPPKRRSLGGGARSWRPTP